MAVNAYLMPLVGDGTRFDAFRPKYTSASGVYLRFGAGLTFLVIIQDIDAGLHTTIAGDSECVVFPPFNNAVGAAALATVRAKLESLNMPGNWVQSGTTYRAIARACALFCLLCQRYEGVDSANLFDAGITLATQWNALSQGVKTRLQEVAAAWSLDTSAMTGNTTIRQILKALADAMTDQFDWFGETF